jgi:hypothetical protein
MPASTAGQLTKQFYVWEQRGRGWFKADFACDLEPPFAPFFGHTLPESPVIDDGKRPSFFQTLFGTTTIPEEAPQSQEEEIKAYPYNDETPLTIFSVSIPKRSITHAEHMEQLLVMLMYRNRPISFELVASEEEIIFQMVCRGTDSKYLETQIKAFFPDFGIIETFDDAIEGWLDTETCIYTIDFGLAEEFMRPLAQLTGKESLIPLFGFLERLKENECVIIQVLFSGLRNPWAEHMLNAVHDNDGKSSFFYDEPDMLKFSYEKVSRPLCAATIRTMVFSDTMQSASTLLENVATTLMHSAKSPGNSLLPLSDASYSVQDRMVDMLLRQSHRTGMLLNSKELANLAHFPLVPLRKTASQRLTKAVPACLTAHEYCIGLNEHQGIDTKVTLSNEQRSHHLHVIGSTGTGKSTLLHSLMMEDTRLGNGYMCIDPHGDLIDLLLDSIPKERVRDVVLIDPSDSEFPIGFNILSAHSELEKELLASDLVALFRRFSTSWGDQMNSVFANAILAFLYNTKGGTLADLRRFLIEASFRNQILTTVTDQDIVYYWLHEYPLLKSNSIGSILTRLDSFLRPKVIRNMVCQKINIDFADLMDSQKIILVKLSHGLLGAENSFLLGAFIVSKLQQIAMSRQAQAKASRIPFYCYIDEFHQFTTPSMIEILSGARKYGLGLILAHQDMQQVQKYDSDIANSLLSNAGTRICMKLGDTDAKRLQDGFASFSADDLQNLATGEAIIRVNTASIDCTISVMPYISTNGSYKDEIINNSRKTYSAGLPIMSSSTKTPPPNEPKPSSPPRTTPSKPIIVNKAKEHPHEQIREHRYLQNVIKKMAEGNSYKAQLEIRTPDGTGQVDVLLEKDNKTIAIEISVSTTAQWELHNIRKCLAANYTKIVVCTKSASKASQIRRMAMAELTAIQQAKIHVITPEDIQTLFVKEKPTDTVSTMKGYRVKVNYEQSGNVNTNDIIQRIVNLKK